MTLTTGLVVAVIGAVVAGLLAGVAGAIRYVTTSTLVTSDEVEQRHEMMVEKMDTQTSAIRELETLVTGSEYEINDGVLEIVSDNQDRITLNEEDIRGLEQIQIRMLRRQDEHTGGEDIVEGDTDTRTPSRDRGHTDTHTDEGGS